MNVGAEPTLSESIEDTTNIDTWNMERTLEMRRAFIDGKLANAALEQIVL